MALVCQAEAWLPSEAPSNHYLACIWPDPASRGRPHRQPGDVRGTIRAGGCLGAFQVTGLSRTELAMHGDAKHPVLSSHRGPALAAVCNLSTLFSMGVGVTLKVEGEDRNGGKSNHTI